MLSPRNIRLVPVRFIAVQPLVCITQRHIQQRFFLLVAFQVERLKCCPVWRDVLQVSDVMTPPVCHQRPFTQVHLRCAMVGTRRKVHDFLLRLLRFDVGEKGSRHRFRWGIGSDRRGGNFRLCFLLPWLFTGSLRHGFHFRLFRRHLFLVMLLCQFPKFLPAFRCQAHHHLIEAIDGRIGFPVQCGIDVVRVGRLGGAIRFHFLVFRYWIDGWSRWRSCDVRCRLHLRLWLSGLCCAYLFRCLFLFGGFRLADFFRHAPKVKQ